MSKHITPLLSVYNGRELAGFVLGRGPRGFEAFAADASTSLGLFATREAAIESVCDPPDKERGLARAANTGKAGCEMVDQLKGMIKEEDSQALLPGQARHGGNV
jgi:hypothetical protein